MGTCFQFVIRITDQENELKAQKNNMADAMGKINNIESKISTEEQIIKTLEQKVNNNNNIQNEITKLSKKISDKEISWDKKADTTEIEKINKLILAEISNVKNDVKNELKSSGKSEDISKLENKISSLEKEIRDVKDSVINSSR